MDKDGSAGSRLEAGTTTGFGTAILAAAGKGGAGNERECAWHEMDAAAPG